MATINLPDTDEAADRRWQREQAALRQVWPGDVLALVMDDLQAEADETKHPLYSLGAITWTARRRAAVLNHCNCGLPG